MFVNQTKMNQFTLVLILKSIDQTQRISPQTSYDEAEKIVFHLTPQSPASAHVRSPAAAALALAAMAPSIGFTPTVTALPPPLLHDEEDDAIVRRSLAAHQAKQLQASEERMPVPFPTLPFADTHVRPPSLFHN